MDELSSDREGWQDQTSAEGWLTFQYFSTWNSYLWKSGESQIWHNKAIQL